MPHCRRSPRRFPPAGLLLTTAALTLLATLPAGARELDVAMDPDHATWQDSIEVTVSGEVITSCGPQIVTLTVAHAGFELVVLELDHEPCDVLAPPTTHPFSVSVDLPPLIPSDYTLLVRDLVDDTETEHAFTVHEVSPFELVVPAVVTSDEVAHLEIRGWASCPHAEAGLVDGVIEGVYDGECHVLPPDPRVFAIDVPVGPLPAGRYPIHVVDLENRDRLFGVPSLMRGTLRVWDATGCVPSPTVLCLQDGRFRVEVAWTDFQGGSGPGRPIPLPDREDSGLFWFFDPANIELTVKVLDACVVNNRFWVFVASGSTVEYTLIVTDTVSHVTRTYGNDLGEVPSLLPDTAAFATCP
ncbi:MAG TPA: hypothetical protein VM617_02110 [Thermoanaerobaculia bacterium]|nr:hypothetical protein [Thermoanaerobaculia bacterium]